MSKRIKTKDDFKGNFIISYKHDKLESIITLVVLLIFIIFYSMFFLRYFYSDIAPLMNKMLIFEQDTPLSQKALIYFIITVFYTVVHIFIVFFIYFGYKKIGYIINTFDIKIGYDSLEVESKPMPFLAKKRKLNKNDISQIFCTVKLLQTSSVSTSSRTSKVYQLNALLKDGIAVKLLDNIDEKEDAFELEKIIEEKLNIEDTHVDGEIEKGINNLS